MAEAQEQSQSASPDTSTEQTTEQTLEQVYKTFNVEETASQFHQEPVQRQEQAPARQETASPNLGAEIPDPVLDQAGFKSWLATQNTDLRKTLGELRQTQQRLAVGEMRRQEESDIKVAVQTVKEKIGGDIDDDFVEISLGMKARRDPRFASIYAQRHKNPAAWRAALGAVSNEIKGSHQFRQDHQLTENVRAARQSTQTSLTAKGQGNENPTEKALAGAKTQQEFDRIWSQTRDSG